MNNKITIYELLGKIKDGQAPKEIKYQNYLLSFDDVDKDYYCEFYGELFEYLFANIQTTELLNDEVEILDNEDEDEDIEEMTMCTSGIMGFDAVEHITTELKDKLNNLVREVNKLKKEKCNKCE